MVIGYAIREQIETGKRVESIPPRLRLISMIPRIRPYCSFPENRFPGIIGFERSNTEQSGKEGNFKMGGNILRRVALLRSGLLESSSIRQC